MQVAHWSTVLRGISVNSWSNTNHVLSIALLVKCVNLATESIGFIFKRQRSCYCVKQYNLYTVQLTPDSLNLSKLEPCVNLNQNQFPLDFCHTFTAISPLVTFDKPFQNDRHLN